MAWRVCLVAGLSSVLLSGCASSGNQSIADATHESVSAELIKGKTTQENVRGLYGDPSTTSFTDSGNEIWEYDFSRMHSKPTNFIPYVNLIHSGAEGDKKSLVIFFRQEQSRAAIHDQFVESRYQPRPDHAIEEVRRMPFAPD